MKKFLLLTFLSGAWLMAANLSIVHAKVKAHTEVFGDSNIDPVTTHLTSHLKIGKTIESMSGSIDIAINRLKSDNSTRDEHMGKTLNISKYPFARYTIQSVKKSKNGYTLHGLLDFHGVKKPLDIQAKIRQNNNKITLDGTSSFLMTKYKVTPPKLFFLTVRDRIDLSIHATFKKK